MQNQVTEMVLVVEDDEAARLMMQTTLENAGFGVITAGTCSEARVVFAAAKVDVVLLDVLLPDGDGFSLCREFLATPQGKDLPVAMVTGLGDLESIRLSYDSGATDFITKPVSWGTLPYRLHYLLRASRAIADLSLSESKTRALLSGIPDIIMRIHKDFRVLDMQVGSYVFDMDEWLNPVPDSNEQVLPQQVVQVLSAPVHAALIGQGLQLVEFQWSREPRRVRFWEARILQRDSEEVLVVVREITQRKQQENQMRLWAKMFEGSNEAILITDAEFHILSVNKAYVAMMGFSQEEIIGIDTVEVGAQLHTHSFYRNMIALLKERGHWQGELFNQRKSGEIFPCWFSITQVTDADGNPENYIAIFNDITEHKNSRAQIEFLAHHDNLTGLPNRVLLNDRLDMAITQAQRQDEKLGVLFIDLDRFKNINDSLGHSVGDGILKEAALRLSDSIRTGDTVSRLGGDEFVVLFPKVRDESALADLTVKLCHSLQQPYIVDGISLHITPSVGIAVFPGDGVDPSSLIKNADAAMYLAKEKGRNNYQFYTPVLNARTLDRLKLESDLRQAIELNQLELHYQPQIVGKSGELWGAESLVRWRHPERGLVSPADFIPLAEETGLIVDLGDWVMKTAVSQLAQWVAQGREAMVVSINISALQFRQADFARHVETILRERNVNPAQVELELTETMLMNDVEAAINTLNELRAMGVRLAIDDFGTGFSSLNYLRRFPINVLKIDQSFVREMRKEPETLAIVESIIGLAHSLGKETIAEGVETIEDYELLCERGCRLLQGYYIARPMPAQAFDSWCKEHALDKPKG